ncbi:CBS domain-containing protein [Neptunomonas sp.]|uniref:CBS domain-containing protein n=1 Tax=Neptunomonas sp. TaxID=1971898 RepID=UPI0035626BE7
MNNSHALKTVSLSQYKEILESEINERATLESPASLVLTDFLKTRPFTMHMDTIIDQAMAAMRTAHVRSIVVTDSNDKFRGIITTADLMSRKVLSLATSSGQARNDITIGELMIPKEKLVGVTIDAIQTGNIGELLQTLKNEGCPHMLVVEPQHMRIRGIISSSDIARLLQLPVEINQRASSFKELVDVISSGREVS